MNDPNGEGRLLILGAFPLAQTSRFPLSLPQVGPNLVQVYMITRLE